MNETSFFQDLAIVTVIAGSVSAVFGRFRWPKVIGYILAGVLMSPHTWGGGFLSDMQSIQTLGQLGVVFLMFSIGLDFSLREMKKIRNVALPAALLDTVVMTWLGYTVGTRILDWGAVPSLFLGVALCDSATTMLVKVIDEMGWGDRPFVRFTIGTSVCEDIITVGILALVSGVATGGGMDLKAAGLSLGSLLVFFVMVIVSGFVLVPRLLVSVSKRRDDESLLLTILGCMFLVSYIAFRFDFSLALGAFLVGIIGASSDVRRRLAALVAPLRSLFAAVFFVTIGLLVDPSAWLSHLPTILLLTALVVVGKFLDCSFAALVCGEGPKTAVRMGMGLAQIGEFAFMVAMLYITTTKDLSSPMYQIVVAVSLVTTLLNPFFIRWSVPAADRLVGALPDRVKSGLDTYAAFVAKFHAVGGGSELKRDIRGALIRLAVIAVLNFAVTAVLGVLHRLDFSRFSEFFEEHDKYFLFAFANLIMLCMLPMVLSISKTLGGDVARVIVGEDSAKWRSGFRNLIAFVIAGVIPVAYILEQVMLDVSFAPDNRWVQLGMYGVFTLVAAVGWKYFAKAGVRARQRFSEALGAEDRQERIAEVTMTEIPAGIVFRLPVPAGSPAIGETVVTLDIRAKTGASVVSLRRGEAVIRNVGPSVEFQAGDVLTAIGDSAQISALRDLLGVA